MPSDTKLYPVSNTLVDGENNPVICDQVYGIKNGDLVTHIELLKQKHGDQLLLLPLSAVSGGGGIFQRTAPPGRPVIGIQFIPPANPEILTRSDLQITDTDLNQIIIDPSEKSIYAGACITLDQLNTALAETLGRQFKVLGADLTSYGYAQVGSTFMTGGMGPQRRYFSDSVSAITLFNGETVQTISNHQLESFAGTYGWSGIVSAVKCNFHQLPSEEIAFALPVSNSAPSLAKLLQQLAPFCFLDTSGDHLTNQNGESQLIFGIEHITRDAMEPMFARDNDNATTKRARHIAEKCSASNADGVVFINGFSNQDSERFLMGLVDDPESESLTIAGIDLEFSEIFNDPEQMRAVREAVPFAARTQAPYGKFVFKGHTDATIRIHPSAVADMMETLWQSNINYVTAISEYFNSNPAVSGQILVYGHLNPYGIDPHNRVTLASDDELAFKQAKSFLHQQLENYLTALERLCQSSSAEFIGGEKGAGSESEMFVAFGGPDHAPPALRSKFVKQAEVIRAARTMFNWRALPPYNEP